MSMRTQLVGIVICALSIVPLSLAQAAASQTNSIAAHAERANAYLQQKQPELAIPEFEAIIALDPRNLNALANLGVLRYFRNDFAGAIPPLRTALTLQPDLTKIQSVLGMAEKRTGDLSSARKDLEAAFTALPAGKVKVETGMELIDLDTQTHDLDKAAAVVAVLRQDDPTNVTVLYTAYRIYSDLAGESMLSVSLVAPESAQMQQIMAHEEARQGRNNEAIAHYRKALEIAPNLPGVHFELAEMLNSSDDARERESSEAEYKAALKANPLDEQAQARLGEIALKNGEAQRAYNFYFEAVKLNPYDPDANFGMAKALVSLDRSSEALPVFEHALELDPENASIHFWLSTLYRQRGRTDDAQREIAQYKKYKELKEKLKATYKEMQVRPMDRKVDEPDEK